MKQGKEIPSLSVVIPVYNEEETIDKILNLVSTIEIVNEIVIIDDCSKDNSVQETKKSMELISIKNPRINCHQLLLFIYYLVLKK